MGRDVQVFYCDLELAVAGEAPAWRLGYSFESTYPALKNAVAHAGGITNQALSDLSASLQRSWAEGTDEFYRYSIWYKTLYTNDLLCASMGPHVNNSLSDEVKRRYVGTYFCAIHIGTYADYLECANQYPPNNTLAASAELVAKHDNHAETLSSPQDRLTHWAHIVDPSEVMNLTLSCDHTQRIESSLLAVR